MNFKSAIFMIEGGPSLALVKQHITELQRVRAQNAALAEELGITQARSHVDTGVLTAVQFPGKVPDGWTKRDKYGCSRPKPGSAWAAKLGSQQGHGNVSTLIQKAFDVPTFIQYRTGSGEGSRCIGAPLAECGFLFLSADGPYAMWIPDVAAEVADDLARGYTVEEPAKSFRMEIEGCRRIEQEEWDILVLQDKLKSKQAKTAESGSAARAST